MNQIWTVTGTDNRQGLLNAYKQGDEKFLAQAVGGSDVEYFSPETGFVLLVKDKEYNLDNTGLRRIRACAELSLGVPLDLREFYYTIRQTPHLVKEFDGVAGVGLYGSVLNTLNQLEIVTDTPREQFTAGNLPKGFIFYRHNSRYGDEARKVGFTERIAREVLRDYEITSAQTILILEKNSAATRLVELGFSELTNMVITTCGGNFNRAVDLIAGRFNDDKQVIFFCDGDTWGQDMLRTIEYGSQAARHLADKFPPTIYPNIHMAGLFPSVANTIGLPNDIEDKRPLQNPAVQRRIEFQKRFGLIDDRDLATWEQDKTYELEALSTAFKNKKQEPIGLAIYLVEFARIKKLWFKPQPSEDDKTLLDDFRDEAREAFRRQIGVEVDTSFIDELANTLKAPITNFCDEIADKIYSDYEGDLDKYLDGITADDIRRQIAKQYDSSPRREIYSLKDIAKQMISGVAVEVNLDLEAIRARVTEMITELTPQIEELIPEVEEGISHSAVIEFGGLLEVGEVISFYDRVLKVLGARPEDCEKIRQALIKRLQ